MLVRWRGKKRVKSGKHKHSLLVSKSRWMQLSRSGSFLLAGWGLVPDFLHDRQIIHINFLGSYINNKIKHLR